MTKFRKKSGKWVNLGPIRARSDRHAESIADLRGRVIALEAMIRTLREQVLFLGASEARK